MHPKLKAIADRNSSQSDSEPEFFDEADEEEVAQAHQQVSCTRSVARHEDRVVLRHPGVPSLVRSAVSALAEARRGKRTLAEANEADTLEPDGEENTKESVAEAKLKFLK
eukprot:3459911-Pyramimonas_sp.AAC.1